MIKRLLTLLLLLVSLSVYAENAQVEKPSNGRTPFSLKAYPFRGSYLVNPTHYSKFGPIYPAGVHLGMELPSQGQKPWQQYLGDPTVGLGLTWMDLGHEMLGHSVILYPYILFDE